MKFWLLNNRFTFNLFCWICFSAIIHLQKAPITASLEMCLIYNLPHMGENIIIYSKKTFLMLIFEKSMYITYSYLILGFLVNIWDHGKNLLNKIWVVNTTANVTNHIFFLF